MKFDPRLPKPARIPFGVNAADQHDRLVEQFTSSIERVAIRKASFRLLPLVFFIIFLTVIFGRSVYLLFLSIGAVGWLTMARIVRGQTLSIRRREFIEAAVAGGASPPRVIWKHVVPNVLGPVAVYATLMVPQIILFESFLSFLGLGTQEPHASLGTLIAEGAGEMEAAPWILLAPGVFLALLLVSLNVLGDGLRDAFDVREPG